MQRLTRPVVAGLAALALTGTLTACADQYEKDADRSQDNTERLVANQPVEPGTWSPTREQINNWTRTWQSGPGKLAYVYLFNQGQTQPVGYYVLIGPPVSYAASATQPYQDGRPIPGQDGAFYSQGTGANQFYGKDAETGRELEWGGTGVWYLLSDQPLRLKAPPLGDAEIGRVTGN